LGLSDELISAGLYSCSIQLASLYSLVKNDDATSYPIGVILSVAITVVLALIVLLLLQFQLFSWNMEKEIPVIFTITSIESVDELTGRLNYDSRVLLLHTGKTDFQNKNLTARFSKNGQMVPCIIVTMNGNDFISTVHNGVQWMGGPGCSGALWSQGEPICIDFTDGTFHPGDTVRMDIIDKETNVTISRYEYQYN
jgi:hypothetical protein